MKTCSKCKETKDLEQFSKASRSRDGKQHMCKTCNKAWRDQTGHNSKYAALAKDYLLDYKTDKENLNDASIRFFCEVLGAEEWKRLKDTYTRIDSNGCLLWEGAKHPDGYGHIGVRLPIGSYSVKAHRVAYAIANGYENLPHSQPGPSNETLVIDHICEIRNCVNAEHLQVVSSEKNLAFRVERFA